jgi:hypothetical protein
MSLIRPQDVVAQYMGATSSADQRAAYAIYQHTPAREVCRMARELGYTGMNVSLNSVWRDYWHESRSNTN